MMGKGHLATGVSTGITVCTLAAAADATEVAKLFAPDDDPGRILFFAHNIPFCTIGVIMFVMGLLLPDIDSKESMLGKYIHLPSFVGHRTWTHSIWFLGLFVLLGVFEAWFLWLSFGIAIHIAVDAVSAAGVCFFYPFERYKRYANGAFVKKGHMIKLYRTNAPSEGIICVIFVIVAMTSCILFGCYLHGFVKIFEFLIGK